MLQWMFNNPNSQFVKMTSTFLPFLYQTRTLQRVSRLPATFISVHRTYATQRPFAQKNDQSIPFEMDGDQAGLSGDAEKESTITPSEAEIFKGIFDEIAQGRMPKAKKRRSPLRGSSSDVKGFGTMNKEEEMPTTESPVDGPKSIIDQVRVTEFRDKFLERYPVSLRKAAEMALGKFELEPQRPILRDMAELDEEEARALAEWSRYKKIQDEEKERVATLMRSSQTDFELWTVMEEEVFSLPNKLGISQEVEVPTKLGRRPKKIVSYDLAALVKKSQSSATLDAAEEQETTEPAVNDEKKSMDIHGPLYPHYLTLGLELFDTAFLHSSPLAFKILPRVKELGLPSYVLGVTTPFYTKLAQMHWNRFGDAGSAFDMLEEMRSLGLTADEEVATLLTQVRDHLHGCTWGAQGPFVMAMMESAPYDTALAQRLEASERFVRRSFHLQRRS
ncbi:Fc.00g011680.m01.CDS01 [Cosmosporella sp. VM-42]